MIIWGTIWGAVIGLFLGSLGSAWGFSIFLGALLGAWAGHTLRNAVRIEIGLQKAKWAPSQTVIPAEAPIHVAPEATPEQPPAAISDPLPDEHRQADAAAVRAHPSTQSPQATEPDLVTRAVTAARNWLFGGNTIVRVGVVVLFVGLAFLAKYAIDNAILPPELRLASIGLTGIALFVFGFRLRAKRSDKLAYAITLQGAGVAVLYLTVFAAFRLYQFLPAGAAFVVLGLICTFAAAIALLQNAMPMALIGFAGAFAAPLLVSTGQDNHVGLFSYYLLLNLTIVSIAWLRAWRPLNLLGFFATFGVATLWGTLKYRPEQFASTEPFLIAFFLIYVLASLLYATRHSLAPKQAVDATLIFGTPLIAFGLQAGLVHDFEYATAFSSLITGGFYLGLGLWAMRRARQGSDVGRWLAECFVALGLGFVTLAVPLALDAHWTSAVWAAEGAAVYWMGHRQGRWLARAIGLALQLMAALFYLSALGQQVSHWPLANSVFIGASLLAFSAFALAHWSRNAVTLAETPAARQFGSLEQNLSPVLFWIGFLWWQFALGQEINRNVIDLQGMWRPVFENAMQDHLRMLAWLGSAFVAHRLALAHRAHPWDIAATPAWFNLPVMLLIALSGMDQLDHVFQSFGWLVWPIALVLHGVMLRRLDAAPPNAWRWSWIHSGGIWLMVLLGGNALIWAVQQAQLQYTAWASVILLTSATAVLLALAQRIWFDPTSTARQRWPLNRFADAYLWRAAMPVALLVALGCVAVAIHSNGNARPLPYVPLLNPTDLSIALGLGACTLWLMRLRQSTLSIPLLMQHPRLPLALVAIAFIAVNTVWLRVAHQFAGVPWNADNLFESFLVQAGYSILWTLIAMSLMIVAYRRQLRPLWVGGAALLGMTVLKLFLIDLSNHGGSERIMVFIAVGALMLVVGYYAPMPPPAAAESNIPREISP
ncbi:MAG: DUF2339 domain-containing protein [Rhodocyclaceae bacterium]|nr:DUF2339 domain-containing protein [Rhodocyclaceae bacterium]